jgi:hypothetical protein
VADDERRVVDPHHRPVEAAHGDVGGRYAELPQDLEQGTSPPIRTSSLLCRSGP